MLLPRSCQWHDGTQTLSNHIPVSTTFTMVVRGDGDLHRSSYLKMEAAALNNSEVDLEVRSLWKAQQLSGRDPRINVDLAWDTVRRYLREEKKEATVG